MAFNDVSLELDNIDEPTECLRSNHSRLEMAILQTIAYADIFDYPLTAREIQRYCINVSASRAEVDTALFNGRLVPGCLSTCDSYYTLPGREHIIETRRRRAEQARRDWALAFRYGRIIASLPFVRMVAVTGELAMDNVRPESDIDYFIVTSPGRLWITRLMIIAIVRLAGLRGPEICPNYLVSERALVFDDRNLYTAHEVAQMAPISGLSIYQELRDINPWVQDYLPNAGGPSRSIELAPRLPWPGKALEFILSTRFGGLLERWEMSRKIRKLTGTELNHRESSYSSDRCKGHVSGHGARIIALADERWQAVKATIQ